MNSPENFYRKKVALPSNMSIRQRGNHRHSKRVMSLPVTHGRCSRPALTRQSLRHKLLSQQPRPPARPPALAPEVPCVVPWWARLSVVMPVPARRLAQLPHVAKVDGRMHQPNNSSRPPANSNRAHSRRPELCVLKDGATRLSESCCAA
jgi:hypothetical protein